MRVIQHPRTDSYEAVVLDDAAVHGRVMADRHALAHMHRVKMPHAVKHGAVLHIGTRPDAD